MTAVAILLKLTVIMAIALAGTRLARNSRAAVRHVLLAAAFVVLLVLPIASFFTPTVSITMPAAMTEVIAPLDNEPIVAPEASSTPTTGAPAGLNDSSRWTWPPLSVLLIGGWLAGTVVLLLHLMAGLWQVRSLRRSALPWGDGRAVVDALAAGSTRHRRIEFLVHESLPGPMTCGVLWPAIVLPGDAQTWSDDDLRRAVVHEMEHVRRADWMSQVLVRIVAAVYWFHPIVWMAWRQLSLEAERACDDAVLASHPLGAGLDPSVAYADQLVLLAQRLSTTSHRPQLAMANRSDLATRVVAVLDTRQQRGRAGARSIGIAAAACALVVVSMSSLRIVSAAQSPAPAAPQKAQKFEVASVKPCEPGQPGAARGGGAGNANSTGSINLNCQRTASLIHSAFVEFGGLASDDPILAWTRFGGIDFSGNTPGPLKVRGGPAWVYSERFAIEAKAAGASERSVMMGPMLRSLLEDRFRLKVHQETEEAPMWALTVASGGPKLTRPTPGDCVELGPGVNPTWEQIKTNRNARYCGRAFGEIGDSFTLRAGGQSVSDIATTLTRDLGVKVIDRTGLAGVFNYTLEYAIDENTTLGASYASLPVGQTAPTIFAAVEQQLGLKLVKITGPRGFLVIDHIERPTPDFAASAATSGKPGLLASPERARGSR